VLTKADFRALQARTAGSATPLSEEEVDLLFELLDANGDGVLQLHEVVGMLQRDGGAPLPQGGGGASGAGSTRRG
jgi:hypothetical protein